MNGEEENNAMINDLARKLTVKFKKENLSSKDEQNNELATVGLEGATDKGLFEL